MLINSGVPKTYWPYACFTVQHAAFTIGRTPASGIKSKVPYEELFHRRVNASFFRPFGCTAYALLPKDQRGGKFNSHARKCILLGYRPGSKAYMLLDVATRKIIVSRHVRFDETKRTPVVSTDVTLSDNPHPPIDNFHDLLRQSVHTPALEDND
ncbi:hypothetical protein FISHEDRAFT_6792, partial [Fistulina hepatica ATCC 64428]